jgi:hypothetical protein
MQRAWPERPAAKQQERKHETRRHEAMNSKAIPSETIGKEHDEASEVRDDGRPKR